MTKTITLLIAPNGETKVETHGFDGQSCTDATKFLETALGRRTEQQFKSEYFATNTNVIQTETKL